MYWPDTNTVVDIEPPRKPVASAVRKFFTEGGAGQPPTVPGGDWFNQITNELLNVLAAAGIDPSKADDDQLLKAIQGISNAEVSYEALRRTYLESGYLLRPRPESFKNGGTLTSANDVLLDPASGKAYSGSGPFPQTVSEDTIPVPGSFKDRSPATTGGDITTTQGLLLSDLTGIKKITTVAFSDGWAAMSSVVGGATWVKTGVIDVTKASSINAGFLYDASGNQFANNCGRVSPQQFGATAGVDCSSQLQMCLNRRKVFLEDDILLTATSTITVNGTTIDLSGKTITCSLGSANAMALDLNNKIKFSAKNGNVTFITAGKFVYGNVKGAKVYDIDFTGGTLALQFVGTYGDECTDIKVKGCTHDGTTPTLGAGGFFSVQIGRKIYVIDCTGKGGGEFIDINNLCSYVWIRGCLSEDYKQNHWDINSAWHVKITDCTVISNISGLISRPVWISDTTLAEWPVGAPDRLKNSNYVSIRGCNFRINNMDYSEFFIANCGTGYNPFVSEGRRLIMSMSDCVFDNDTGVLSKDKIKLGVTTDVIAWNIHDVSFNGCAATVVGAGKFHDNTFDPEQEGLVGNALDIKLTDGDVADNIFIGWTGTPTASSTGGVLFSRDCVRTTFTSNKFKSTTPCYAPITAQGGGTNQYIENRFSMAVTDVNGVRENGGDVVIYNGA
ncbi:hypothetical protein [Aeromonas caviae]|uniref:hypothetical protein n=1 Tax=Aeromonas caviae TaxID=648 RepID=UPI002DD6A646|nr:hypothetical protein [Aeromonas caviae]